MTYSYFSKILNSLGNNKNNRWCISRHLIHNHRPHSASIWTGSLYQCNSRPKPKPLEAMGFRTSHNYLISRTCLVASDQTLTLTSHQICSRNSYRQAVRKAVLSSSSNIQTCRPHITLQVTIANMSMMPTITCKTLIWMKKTICSESTQTTITRMTTKKNLSTQMVNLYHLQSKSETL